MTELVKQAPVDTPNRTRRKLGSVGSAVYRPVERVYGPLHRLFNRVLTGSSSVYDLPPMGLLMAAPVIASVGIFAEGGTLTNAPVAFIFANLFSVVGWGLSVAADLLSRPLAHSEHLDSSTLQIEEGSSNG